MLEHKRNEQCNGGQEREGRKNDKGRRMEENPIKSDMIWWVMKIWAVLTQWLPFSSRVPSCRLVSIWMCLGTCRTRCSTASSWRFHTFSIICMKKIEQKGMDRNTSNLSNPCFSKIRLRVDLLSCLPAESLCDSSSWCYCQQPTWQSVVHLLAFKVKAPNSQRQRLSKKRPWTRQLKKHHEEAGGNCHLLVKCCLIKHDLFANGACSKAVHNQLKGPKGVLLR